LILFAAFPRIDLQHAPSYLVEDIGHTPHVIGVSHNHPGGVVHHVKGVFGHNHLVAYEGNDRGNGRCDAVDIRRDRRRVLLEKVVDGDAVEDFTARAVDVQVDLRSGDRRKLFLKALCGGAASGPEVFPDLIVNPYLGFLRLVSNLIPFHWSSPPLSSPGMGR